MGNDLPDPEKKTPIFPLSVLGKSIDIQEFQLLLSPRQTLEHASERTDVYQLTTEGIAV
ncbi:MAG: hypothetical protein F6K47_37625 [Symploca sp. SIO2E6]|nr:hypothetical protein [Symploca sp. SIO2E6]